MSSKVLSICTILLLSISLFAEENLLTISGNNKPSGNKFELDFYTDTDETYSLGAGYRINKDIKLSLGGLRVEGIDSKFYSDSNFTGAYCTLELRQLFNDIEAFVDLTYVIGGLGRKRGHSGN